MTIGWRTLDVGEQALVYDQEGRARIEDGPQRLFLFREKFVWLKGHSANQSEYLKIAYNDGTIVHKPGPVAMFHNPVYVSSIEVKKGVSLDANEVLVVYRLDPQSNTVRRYLRHGPTIFIPIANEWLHDFVWHGTDPNNKTRKLPGGLRFTKLQVIPDQFYYNVDEVRTADDALIRVKLMIFYELRDIERMLNATQDPIADFINCTSADVIAFSSKLTYMEFIEKAGQLNDLCNYPQLLERCKVIGYEVPKVVFRGYHTSPKLQSMHDNAIEKRTRLKIAYETEEQQQTMTDIQLVNDFERITLEQQMEIADMKHRHTIEVSEEEHKLFINKQECMERVKQRQRDYAANLQGLEALDDQKLDHYKKLHGLSVNVTDYILSQNPLPNKVIKVVSDGNQANFHIHQTTM